MALEHTPCKIGNTWCIYTDQSWDCGGGNWQVVTGDGELVAWMTGWDGQLYESGDIAGIKHYAWDDPEVTEFKESLKLTRDDILDIWCELRVDPDGSYRARSRIIDWEELYSGIAGVVGPDQLLKAWRQDG